MRNELFLSLFLMSILFIGSADSLSISTSNNWNAVNVQTEAPYQIQINPESIVEWTTDNGDNTSSYYMSYRGTFQNQGVDKVGTKYLGFSFDTAAKAGSYVRYRNFNTTGAWTTLSGNDFSYKANYVVRNTTKYNYVTNPDNSTTAIPYYEVESYKDIYYSTFPSVPKGTYKDFEVYVKMDSKPSSFIMYFGTGSTIVQLTKNGNLNVVMGENQSYGYVSNLRTADCTLTTQNDTDPSLVGYWSFDDGTGYSIAHDGSRYENHGTLYDNTTICSGGSCPTWTTGNISGGITFDGLNDSVDAGSNVQKTTMITVSAWIKLQNTGNPIVTYGDPGYAAFSYMLSSSSLGYKNRPSFVIANSSGNQISATSGGVLNNDTWYYIVGTYDNVSVKFYLNGVLKENTSALGGDINYQYTRPVRFGMGTSTTAWYNGSIDEVKIYNRALNSTEIQNQFNNGKYRLNTITNLSSSACSFDIWSNNNRSLIYDIPEVSKTISLTPTYVWNGTNVIFNTTNSGYVANPTIITTNNYLGNANLTLLNITNANSMSVMDTILLNLTALNYSTNANFQYFVYRKIDANNRAWKQDNAIGYVDNCKSGNTTGLVGCWSFEEGYSNNATPLTNDRSGYNNDGTLTNMNLGIDNGSSGWTTSGKFGNGMNFDGVNDYVRAANGVSLNVTDLTMSIWVNALTSTCNGQCVVISKSTYSNRDSGYSMIVSNNTFWAYIGNGSASDQGLGMTENAIGWNYYVATYSNTTGNLSFYKNGILRGSKIIPNFRNDPTQLDIGYRGGWNYYFNGTIDEVRIYNRSLTSAEITSEYNRGKDRLLLTRNEEGSYTANSDWLILLANGTVPDYVFNVGDGYQIYTSKWDNATLIVNSTGASTLSNVNVTMPGRNVYRLYNVTGTVTGGNTTRLQNYTYSASGKWLLIRGFSYGSQVFRVSYSQMNTTAAATIGGAVALTAYLLLKKKQQKKKK